MSWIVVAILVIFLTIWMALTFTNQLCVGPVGFGLCYKTDKDPACPVCPTPTPVPVSAPMPVAGTSHYEMEPYSK